MITSCSFPLTTLLFFMKVIAWLNKELNEKKSFAPKPCLSSNHRFGIPPIGSSLATMSATTGSSLHNVPHLNMHIRPDSKTSTSIRAKNIHGFTPTAMPQRDVVYAPRVTPNATPNGPTMIPTTPCHFRPIETQARHFVPSAINLNR